LLVRDQPILLLLLLRLRHRPARRQDRHQAARRPPTARSGPDPGRRPRPSSPWSTRSNSGASRRGSTAGRGVRASGDRGRADLRVYERQQGRRGKKERAATKQTHEIPSPRWGRLYARSPPLEKKIPRH
jgi:hypothetical protein